MEGLTFTKDFPPSSMSFLLDYRGCDSVYGKQCLGIRAWEGNKAPNPGEDGSN